MNILNIGKIKITALLQGFSAFSFKKKLFLLVLVVACLTGGIWWNRSHQTQKTPQYETTIAKKDTLITSIAGSGTITTGNTTSIKTGATGTVKTMYAKNGDTVKKGDKIAEVTLDEYGQKRQAAAWLSYVNATNAVKTAQTSKNTTDIDMWNARQDIIDAEDDIEYITTNPIDPTTKEAYTLTQRTNYTKALEKAKNAFAAAEAKYKTYDADITNAQVRVTSAWYDYQQVSATITAPESGEIQNLILAVGTVISNTSDTSITIDTGVSSSNSLSTNTTLSASSQSVGFIKSSEGQFKATVSLTEIDIPSIKPDQKVTLTMDAFPDNTFTGRVLAVDTNGSVSSGVTTYPVTVLLDTTDINIYPKMAVSANIITLIKNDIILIPTTAIDSTNTNPTVQVMKDGKPTSVTVTLGSANDLQTEITSGLSAGDEIITSSALPTSTTKASSSSSKSSSTSKSSSIFSGMGGMGGMGGPPGQ